MIVAITGATGFLGMQVVRVALERGHTVRSLVRGPTRLSATATAEIVEGALGDSSAIEQLVQDVDVLIHCAAHGVRRVARRWEACAQVNVVDSLTMLLAAKKVGLRSIVAVGTCLEYEGFGRLPDDPWDPADSTPLCTESSSLESAEPYGATKAAGGIVLRAIAREQRVPMTYLRLASMYGRGHDEAGVLPAVLTATRERRPLDLTAGNQVREWLHVSDGAAAVVSAAEKPPRGVETINIGTGEGYRLRDVIALAVGPSGTATTVRFGAIPDRDEPHWLVMDQTRRRQRLDWEPQIGLEQGLHEMTDPASESPHV